jgi:hypothetical protein
MENVNSNWAPAASPIKAPIRDPLMQSDKSVGVHAFIRRQVNNTKCFKIIVNDSLIR